MASRPKKSHLTLETPDNTESSSCSSDGDVSGRSRSQPAGNNDESSSSCDDGDSSGSDVDVGDDEGINADPLPEDDREIQVEFEARSPQECDFYGICHLLKQMLRHSAHVHPSVVANYVIGQRNVGSVITQSYDGGNDADGDSEDEDDAGAIVNSATIRQNAAILEPNNEVFGLGTVIRLERTGDTSNAADQIVAHLVNNVRGADKQRQLLQLLTSEEHTVGFLISERIINMPPQISVPMYETLSNEIRRAKNKNLPFHFTLYVMISHYLVNPNNPRAVIFTNAEEEVFLPECTGVYDLDFPDETSRDTTADANGQILNSFAASEEFLEKRRVLVFPADKFDRIVSLVKGAFPITS